MLSPGTRVGHYDVVAHVGATGTTAEVYHARQEETGRDVALKLLGAPTPQALREAAVVVRLDHPRIVPTYEVITYGGRLCLVQAWVDGWSLETLLARQGVLGAAETVRLGQALASALAHAHSQGVLHRDLKPSNVLVGRRGDYNLVDFGAVGLLDVDSGLTQAGQIAGTPLYMSPEQAVGAPQSAASDLFGLGLLLFRCLHGTTPGESSANYFALLVGRSTAPIEVPESPLRALLGRCLAVDPALRPQSAREVLAELDRIAALVMPGSEFGQHLDAPVLSHPVPADTVQSGIPWHPTPRSRSHALKAVAIAVVAAAVVLLALLLAPTPAGPGFWVPVGVGVVLVPVALLAAGRVRRLVGRAPDTERRAIGILAGAGSRSALTESMVLEVDQVVAKLKGLDAKFLGLTMVMLIREAEEAKESADRVAALVQMVTLMEKLTKQLSPWYVRHKEAIATGIAVVGSLAGVATVVSGFLR